jgi:hypothetical protein
MSLKTVVLDGKTWRWRDVLRLRREQAKEAKRPQQETLFPLKEDSRPVSQRTAAGRYESPTLFKVD